MRRANISAPSVFMLTTICGSLELCWLGQNRIEVFSKPNPGQRYHVPRLQQLWLNMNLLREAPQEVLSSSLTDLRYIKISKACTILSHTRTRRLDHNRIRAFPNFDALGCLRNLRMQHNEVSAFVPSMTALVQLKEMDLSQASQCDREAEIAIVHARFFTFICFRI